MSPSTLMPIVAGLARRIGSARGGPNVTSKQPLRTGTRIVAIRNFGPIKAGVPGIVTGTVEARILWYSKAMYSCTFAGNVRAQTKPKDIDVLEHGYSLLELESPQFGLNELLRMRLRTVRTG